LEVDISERTKVVNFEVIPKRLVVERTFGWIIAVGYFMNKFLRVTIMVLALNFMFTIMQTAIENSRSLSKDYGISAHSEEAFVMLYYMYALLRRLRAALTQLLKLRSYKPSKLIFVINDIIHYIISS